MADTFRALCSELAEEVEHLWGIVRDDNNEPHPLADRARAELAQPEPLAPKLVYRYSPVTVAECGGPCEQGPQYCDCGEIKGEPAPEPVAPTDKELYELWNSEGIEADFQDCRRFARAYAARWGRPIIEPVAPTDEELARRFRVWWHDEGSGLPPLPGMDHKEHVRRISEIAWASGAYAGRYGTPANNTGGTH